MEEFDVLDENGEYKNVTASREECHKKGLWHRAVVIFILEKENQKILLQQKVFLTIHRHSYIFQS